MTAAADIRAAVAAKDAGRLTALLRASLRPEAIPDDLKTLNAWLVWKVDKLNPESGKFAKVPLYPRTRGRRSGQQGSPSDRAKLGTFDQAISTFSLDDGIAGIGLALLPEFNLVALDVDNCFGLDGVLRAGVGGMIEGTYSEVSPSGRGIRAFWRGEVDKLQNHERGIELYSAQQFVTVTGNQWDGPPPATPLPVLASEHRAALEAQARPDRVEAPRRDDRGMVEAGPLDIHESTVEDLRSALRAIPSDDRDLWVRMGLALKTLPDGIGREPWFEWSEKSVKFDHEDAVRVWDSFDPEDTHWREVFVEAKQWGWKNPWAGKRVPAGSGGASHGPLHLQTIAEVMTQGSLSWLIKGVLPRGGVAELYGPPSAGKTFVVLNACLAIARGLPTWHGRRVKQAGVVYVAAEGGGGMAKRLLAYQEYHDLDLGGLLSFRMVTVGVNIREEADRVVAACAEMPDGVGVVVLDTMNRTMGGGDENSSKEMGQYLQGAAQIGEATGALVLIIHHPGKNEDLGARGHSSLLGNIDCEMKLRRDGNVRVLEVTKQRDGSDGDEFAFHLHTVHLGTDEDGDPVTSCVAVEADLSEADSHRAKPRGKWQGAVYAAVGQGGCSTVDDILEAIEEDAMEAMPPRWRENAKRAKRELENAGLIVRENGTFQVR